MKKVHRIETTVTHIIDLLDKKNSLCFHRVRRDNIMAYFYCPTCGARVTYEEVVEDIDKGERISI